MGGKKKREKKSELKPAVNNPGHGHPPPHPGLRFGEGKAKSFPRTALGLNEKGIWERFRELWLLGRLGLVLGLAVAAFQRVPGAEGGGIGKADIP